MRTMYVPGSETHVQDVQDIHRVYYITIVFSINIKVQRNET
jgi:hypothetical protein